MPPSQSVLPAVWTTTARQTDADELYELLTVEDVAALLKVSKSWVYEHTRSHNSPQSQRLPHIKVGKYVRFDPRALQRFIEKQCRRT